MRRGSIIPEEAPVTLAASLLQFWENHQTPHLILTLLSDQTAECWHSFYALLRCTMADGLVILLHGFGSSGDDLAGLAAHWGPQLPGVRFASPNAPERFPQGAGYQWFSLDGITSENRPQRIAAARAAFDRTLNDILRQHNLSDRPEKVMLVGFSQGSMMALDAVASGRWPLAGVVAFSGRLASPLPLSASVIPVMLIHGMADSVIPYQESEQAAGRLRERGLPVTTQLEPSTGHTISASGARAAAGFIAEHLT